MTHRLHVLFSLALLPLLPATGLAQSASQSRPVSSSVESGGAPRLPSPPFTPEQRAEIVEILRHALQTDPSILRDAVTAMRADDEQQRQASARSALVAEQTALFHDPADQIGGNPKGDVTVVVFYDPRCPYCRRLNPTIAALLKADPEVRLVYKDMPILGPASVLESHALVAAQKQGGYLPLMEALMAAPPEATTEMVKAQAEKLGLDWGRMQADMAATGVSQRLDGNIALARRLGIEGTPAMVIGGRLIPGAVDLAELKEAVAAARKG